MRKVQLMICVILSILLSFSSIYGQELDEHLRLLAPLANKKWEGEMPRFGEGTKREVMWNVIWNRKAIKQTTEVKMLNSISETYFYWDSDKQEIGVFSITSNGNFFHGYITFLNEMLEFRNTFELNEKGKLVDKWFTFRSGEWKLGHTFELSKKEE